MASVTIRQTLDVVFLNKLAAKFFLIGRRLIGHVEHLIAWPDILLGIAVTVDAPVHVKGIFFVHQGHLVHAAMAGGASDALVDMDAVVEVYEIRQVVYTGPLQGFASPETGTHRLQNLGVRPDLRMTAHADLGGWDSGERGCFYRSMTITAVDPVVADVMFVAEGYGLVFNYFDVRDVMTTVHRVGESDQSADCDDTARNTYF